MTISRRALLALTPVALAACTTDELNSVLGDVLGGTTGRGGLTPAEAAEGIRAALDQGVSAAIARVGRTNGYLGDPTIRIPLPARLASIQTTLRRFGLSALLDDLEVQINRGAEVAAPQARSIFVAAIRQLTIPDAIAIVNGGPTAATDYFKRTTTPKLTNLFTPIMTDALQRAGAIQTFDQMVTRLEGIPLAPQLGADAKQDLIRHGVTRGLEGLFVYIAEEEAQIRQNPAKRTSEILRRVFG
ncbi:DUF4197 domain-containing protein [Parvularcula lutaonensis]|uniref:DUF4197 domain-containing protein n=1 Tax=Parvularcula lutaonensis TaxID=491923 RepID=A0ABV7M7V9_9PROT|nr:DUF4197 domain-containing protein [Parvularcula lutaonensis]GGY43215.1 hypothetical protein GCM10007148_09910 [Parvularcula lutaonensis]